MKKSIKGLTKKLNTFISNHIVHPKDAVDPFKEDGVVYRVPCEGGKAYIGEPDGPMQDKIAEHD